MPLYKKSKGCKYKMKCPKCQTINDFESVYCYKCGAKLKGEKKQTHHFQYFLLTIFAILNIGLLLVYCISEVLYINTLASRINQRKHYIKNFRINLYHQLQDFIKTINKNLTIFKKF